MSKTTGFGLFQFVWRFFEAIWHFFTSGLAFFVHLDLATLLKTRRGTTVSVQSIVQCCVQARNQLGAPGGAEFFERGANFLNYVQ